MGILRTAVPVWTSRFAAVLAPVALCWEDVFDTGKELDLIVYLQDPAEEMASGDFAQARQWQAERGGYLLREGDRFHVLTEAAARERGWTPEALALAPFVAPGPLAAPDFRPPATSRSLSRSALALAVPVYAALVLALVFGNPWLKADGARRFEAVEAGRTRMVDVELRPAAARPALARAPGAGQGPSNPDPGGSAGSALPKGPAVAAAVADESALAFLGETRSPAELPLGAAQPVLVQARPRAGPGRGTGRGGGRGDGAGAGSGRKGGWTRAELARMAAEGRSLDDRDYLITQMPPPHYQMRPGENLSGSVVLVRVLVGGDGVPVFAEALSGPELLREATTRGALQWRFALAPRAQVRAPVTVLIRYRWIMG
jgi:hypothetical protein